MDSTVPTPKARIDQTIIEPGLAVVSVSGILDWTNFAEADHLVESLYQQGCTRLIVDMANLKFLSSSGIGAFLSYVSMAAEKGGGVVFTNAPGNIMEVFEVTGLSKILRFARDIASARVELGSKAQDPAEESVFFL